MSVHISRPLGGLLLARGPYVGHPWVKATHTSESSTCRPAATARGSPGAGCGQRRPVCGTYDWRAETAADTWAKSRPSCPAAAAGGFWRQWVWQCLRRLIGPRCRCCWLQRSKKTTVESEPAPRHSSRWAESRGGRVRTHLFSCSFLEAHRGSCGLACVSLRLLLPAIPSDASESLMLHTKGQQMQETKGIQSHVKHNRKCLKPPVNQAAH